MPIKIQGKDYVTVHERVAAFHESLDGEVRIETEIVHEDEQYVTVRAKVWTTEASFFTGHARSDKHKQGPFEGANPLEVAETSAIGRALGFAGFGVVDGIATADEVKAAQRKPEPPPPSKRERMGDSAHAPATRTVQQPAAYKGNWSKFWMLAKDKGMTKEEVHGYYGLDDDDSLANLAQHRATSRNVSLQDEIDALTDVLRTVQ